ncbi:MAG: DUF4389 domain-containing protein [Alphaproteobacteria bacterium]|nr:DUF4389 domain-containing protein [Alphaproteobacteria bacterium]
MADERPTTPDPAPPPERDVWPEVFPRILFVIAFGVVLHFALWIVFAVALFQVIVFLVNKDHNPDLVRFGRNLARYLWEVLAYVMWVREEKPFPFGPFPRAADRDIGEDGAGI